MRTILHLRTLSLILLLLIARDGFTQADLRVITPLSPNAAEMVKYGETPVSYFTGIPEIGVPLYNIVSGELKLPLGLSYHAGGNKVESIASWVGLSWSLGALPRISRAVNGLPDEKAFFEKYRGYSVKQLNTLKNESQSAHEDYLDFLADVKRGTADCEPDIFSYNINGKMEPISKRCKWSHIVN